MKPVLNSPIVEGGVYTHYVPSLRSVVCPRCGVSVLFMLPEDLDGDPGEFENEVLAHHMEAEGCLR